MAANDKHEHVNLQNILPGKFRYEIISSTNLNFPHFECCLRAEITCEEEVTQWMSSYEEETKTQWNVRKSVSCERATQHFLFSRDYICQHSSYRKVPGSKKSLDCGARIGIRIKKSTRNTRYRDPFVKDGLVCEIKIINVHSHLIKNAEAWGWLKRKKETEEHFLEYFKSGKSPAEAKRFHEELLMCEGVEKLADGSINPPEKWVYWLHDKWRKAEYGDLPCTPSFLSLALKKKEELEKLGHKICIEESPFSLSVVTPLMQQSLKIEEDKCRSFFIDTSSSCDQSNTALTIVLVSTKAGAVPVGVSLHEGQSQECYTTAFKQIRNLWDEFSTPNIENFMTDDSAPLRNALNDVWPGTRKLLCQFHVPQALWRWLWNSKNGVAKEDRPQLMEEFRRIMYASSMEEAETTFLNLMTNCRYMKFCQHVEKLYDRRDEWCMPYRRDVMNMNHNTNNYAEATFRVLKDIILTRLKAYNPLALLDFIVVVLEKYYCNRLLSAAFGRLKKPYILYQKTHDKGLAIEKSCPDAVVQVDDNSFLVKSSTDDGKTYDVRSDVGWCSCFSGVQGAFCKHQAAVHIRHGMMFPNSPELSTQDKKMLYKIATGNSQDITSAFFEPINSGNAEENCTITTKDAREEPNNVATRDNLATHEETAICPTFNVQLFKSECERISNILEENTTDTGLMTSARKFTQKMQKIKTPMQLYEFINTSELKFYRGRKIRVQPTSLNRRKEGSSRGSARHRSGRPLKGVKKNRCKLQRNLGGSIALNCPNAKSHGDAH